MKLTPLGLLPVALVLLLLFVGAAGAQQDPSEIPSNPDAVLLAVYLRHTQEMNLEQMGAELRARKWLNVFPPEGIAIRGWYLLMGVGHLVILEVPPGRIREVNRALESVAYGVFRVEVRPGYDFLPVIRALQAQYREMADE